MCPGPWPINLFFPVVFSLFWLGVSFMALIIWSIKTCALGPPCPLSPNVPAVAGRQLVCSAAYIYASDSGESLHCFLVGVKIKVIATSELWLFIHASSLLPSLPTPLPYRYKTGKTATTTTTTTNNKQAKHIHTQTTNKQKRNETQLKCSFGYCFVPKWPRWISCWINKSFANLSNCKHT